MLDIDTLNALQDLMANTLYRVEVAQLPKLTQAEEEALIERARRGDNEARMALVVSCLHYALERARHFVIARQPWHTDEMDLSQVASLEMLEAMDRALELESPIGYLRAIAKLAISLHVAYKASLIRIPREGRKKLEKMNIPTVESLDRPLTQESRVRIRMEIIEVAPLQAEDELEAEAREAQLRRRFAPLYEAIESLTPRQKDAIAKASGLDIAEADGPESKAHGYPPRAIEKLRRALEPHWKAMLYPEQEEEE